MADLVSYARFRRYAPAVSDGNAFSTLWPAFDREGEVVHGCVHFTPSFGQGECTCRPCDQRLLAGAAVERVVPTRVPVKRRTTPPAPADR